MTEEKTCYNCGNPNCHIPLNSVRINVKEHHETYDWDMEFDCMDHDKWEELKVEEIRTDNTETLKNALERIEELTKWLSEKSDECLKLQMLKADLVSQIGNQKKRITELEKENAELKETVIKMNNVITETFSNLTKAKSIIKDYKIVAESDHTTVCSVPEENRCINVYKLNESAEQFLKEVLE